MHLTQYTDLALRILMRLAVVPGDSDQPRTPGEGETTRSVSRELALSYAHAAKVVARLQALGLVETRRGRTGGLRITETGRHYSVGRLARQLEGPSEVIECVGANPCPLRNACRLRELLRDAQESFFAVLDPWTIDDLVQAPTGAVLLSLGVRPPD